MLDIKFIRDNKDIVAMAIKNRNRSVDLDELLSVYEERKIVKQKIDDVNKERNEAAREKNIERGIQLKKDLEEAEMKLPDLEKRYMQLMLQIPNIPSPDTPVGKDDTENKILRQVGDIPKFDFTPKEHTDIAAALDILDTETAGVVSGSRFAYIKGDLALLQFALINFCF
jgi:seryl-tRNA synthetase